ncbi:penicillin acylase family protein [Trinickia caryophylli]|uniref:penicillin acylase family protein n=1 Tax=Trinickia caryophylli TaxID=28094 RepID=UPI0030B8E92A
MPRSRLFRISLFVLLGACLLLAAAAVCAILLVRGSLPQLDGTRTVPSLGASVGIERDAQGVATLSGTSREDLAYATGFVHAQDRFFQMDLLRRSAARRTGGIDRAGCRKSRREPSHSPLPRPRTRRRGRIAGG